MYHPAPLLFLIVDPALGFLQHKSVFALERKKSPAVQE